MVLRNSGKKTIKCSPWVVNIIGLQLIDPPHWLYIGYITSDGIDRKNPYLVCLRKSYTRLLYMFGPVTYICVWTIELTLTNSIV